jgi:hypothetical protein
LLVGPRSSGKSLLIKLINNTFSCLIKHDLDSNHLTVNKSSADSARQWDFAKDFYYKRLITSSEFGINILNEKVVKKLQGRDTIYWRGLYQDEVETPTGTSLLLVNNGIILADNMDIYDKFEVLETPYEFVGQPELSNLQKLEDLNVELLFKENDFCLAFMRLVFSYDTTEKPVVTTNMNELKLTLIDDTAISSVDG